MGLDIETDLPNDPGSQCDFEWLVLRETDQSESEAVVMHSPTRGGVGGAGSPTVVAVT
jgi:hypothetical protein